jgi:RNA-directed DNA polymerase
MAKVLRSFACCMTVKATMPARNNDLVVPLATKATDMRATDTADRSPVRSGAADGPRIRPAGVNSTNGRSTPRTTIMRGIRASTTAIRTTTTRTTSSGPAPSADHHESHTAFTLEDLVRAEIDCRRTKRNTASALAWEIERERNLCQLHDELAAGTWRPGRSICFVITRPKPREVWAAQYRDRIVHHLLYNHIGPRFERAFIADSCACIPGRGTLYAAQHLEAKVRSQTANWSRPAWYLKCDLANFFVSIDKRVLQTQLHARIPEPWWRALADTILLHDPRTDVAIHSGTRRMAMVPPHKSLLNQPVHLGLPIGNLSSQFFANIYLDALDQFVKHRLRCRHYIRYVDDFVLLHESPQQLNAWRDQIAAWLPAQLHVRLNDAKTVIQPIARGIDFVGQVIKPWRRTLRRRTYRQALARTATIHPADLLQTANSYFGLLRQATHSHHDRARLANVVRDRGHCVDGGFTKTYRRTA